MYIFLKLVIHYSRQSNNYYFRYVQDTYFYNSREDLLNITMFMTTKSYQYEFGTFKNHTIIIQDVNITGKFICHFEQ